MVVPSFDVTVSISLSLLVRHYANSLLSQEAQASSVSC
jgi:hypothetical protein